MAHQLSDGAKAAIDRVVEKFKSGDLSPVIEVIQLRRSVDDPQFPSSLWSLSNQVLVYMQTGELDCRGFRQWQEVGREVKKGEKAAYILVPLIKKDEDTDAVRVYGFRGAAVFAYGQTEGKDLSLTQADYSPKEMPPLSEVADWLEVEVSWGPTGDGAYGWYSPGKKKIRVGTHQTQVLWHELAHALHDKLEGVRGGQDRHQETVAEFTAAVVSQLYGVDWSGNAWKYISAYNVDPIRAVYKALSTVEKIVALIEEACGEKELVI